MNTGYDPGGLPVLDQILGQEPAVALLRKVLATGRIPHAFLFHGPEGVGKWTTALAFARALLCTAPETGKTAVPCENCRSCRRLLAGAHPDLYRIGLYPKKLFPKNPQPKEELPPLPVHRPDTDKDLLTQIRIHQVRWLNSQAVHAPVEAEWRLFALDPADRLNPQAQNALLKTLEEPESRSMIVLITSRPHMLLPTIRSRCIGVGFKPLDPRELASLLEAGGVSSKESMSRAALAAGRPGTAIALDLPAMRSRRASLLNDLTALAESPSALSDLPRMTVRLLGESDKELRDGLDLLQGLLRDVARLGAGMSEETLLHQDLAPDLKRLERQLSGERAAELVKDIDELRAGLRFNVNKALLADTILASLCRRPA